MQSTFGEAITVGALAVRFLVEADESNDSVTVFECDVPAQARMPAPHSHDAFEETIYGLTGVTTWTVDGEAIEIGPGEAICIPRGVVHGFTNRGSVDAKFLAIATPGVFGPAYFREIGEVLAAGGPPDHGALAEVMHRHGLTPAAAAGALTPDGPTTRPSQGASDADQHDKHRPGHACRGSKAYDAAMAGVAEPLRRSAGFISHAAQISPDGVTVTELWDTREQWQHWFDTSVRPHLPPGTPEPTIVEVLNALGR